MGNRVSKNAPRGLILTGSDPALIQSVLTPHAWTSSEEELAKNDLVAQLTYENQVYPSTRDSWIDLGQVSRLASAFPPATHPPKLALASGRVPLVLFPLPLGFVC